MLAEVDVDTGEMPTENPAEPPEASPPPTTPPHRHKPCRVASAVEEELGKRWLSARRSA